MKNSVKNKIDKDDFFEIRLPFKQSYVVGVNIYYNPDKLVEKYETIE